jgi:phosphatidylglycerophosphatase A
MVKKPKSGSLFGIPYNFEQPSVGRLLSSYWQPGKGMLVKKPFGIGYTLNLASWRSWVVLAVVGALYWHQRTNADTTEEDDDAADDPVEVVIDD